MITNPPLYARTNTYDWKLGSCPSNLGDEMLSSCSEILPEVNKENNKNIYIILTKSLWSIAFFFINLTIQYTKYFVSYVQLRMIRHDLLRDGSVHIAISQGTHIFIGKKRLALFQDINILT